MTAFAFSPQRIRELRQSPGQVSAVLAMLSDPIKVNRTRRFYRVHEASVDGGERTERKQELVHDVGAGGVTRPARLTVLLLEPVDIYSDKPWGEYGVITFTIARACGYRTPQELRDDWKSRHPQSDLGKLVWFALGDVRDRDRFLQRWVSRGGDYTTDWSAAVDDLPALTEEQLKEVAAQNHQRTVKREAVIAHNLADETLAQRVARLENAGDQLLREIKNELNIIRERAERGRRKLDRGTT